MIPQVLELVKDNKGAAIVITAMTVVVLLGGTGTIELPADKKVAELGDAFAQYQQFDTQRQDMHEYEWVQRQINRLIRDMAWLKDASNRRQLSPDELATLTTYEMDLQDLKQYESELRKRLKGGG